MPTSNVPGESVTRRGALFGVTSTSARTGRSEPVIVEAFSRGLDLFRPAAALYAGLTVFWTWLLSRVPLSHAYPFVALGFVFVPAMAWAWFGERVGAGYVVGLLLIVAGLLVIGVTHAR